MKDHEKFISVKITSVQTSSLRSVRIHYGEGVKLETSVTVANLTY